MKIPALSCTSHISHFKSSTGTYDYRPSSRTPQVLNTSFMAKTLRDSTVFLGSPQGQRNPHPQDKPKEYFSK